MARTRARPLPMGQLTSLQTLLFAGIVGGAGLVVLYALVNPLTMWLTLATFVGYAVVYTVILKPLTPQNIVIGGASGAMPPVLGWAAVTGEIALRRAAAVPDHLRLDAAAFLGAGAVPQEGIRQGRRADAAGDPRRPLHPPARAALHADPGRGEPAALHHAHERLDLPRQRAGRWAASSCGTRCGSTSTTATSWRRRPSAIRSSTCRCCSRRCWSTTTCASRW